MKVPYMLVLGPAEAEENCVTVRIRGQKAQEKISLEAFISGVEDNIARRDFLLAWTKKD